MSNWLGLCERGTESLLDKKNCIFREINIMIPLKEISEVRKLSLGRYIQAKVKIILFLDVFQFSDKLWQKNTTNPSILYFWLVTQYLRLFYSTVYDFWVHVVCAMGRNVLHLKIVPPYVPSVTCKNTLLALKFRYSSCIILLCHLLPWLFGTESKNFPCFVTFF